MNEKVIIFGSGTWGTALANLLANKGITVVVCSRFESERDEYSKTRKHPHLPGVEIHKDIVFTCDESLAKDYDIVVFACPSLYMRESVQRILPFYNKNQIFVSVAKGIEKDTMLTMTEIIEDVLGKDIKAVALSGPTHAEEVSIGLPSLIVSASKDESSAKIIQRVFSSPCMRVYTNHDVLGVEICGALKNIIALASGMSRGLGFGDNAQAAIITRGLNEISNLGIKMGCNIKTFLGLTGIGDIVVTASSNHSRNHNAGVLLAKGYSLEETLEKIGMVVEGINALEAAKELEKKYQVEMPIIDMVYSVVHGHTKPSNALEKLFAREQKSEI